MGKSTFYAELLLRAKLRRLRLLSAEILSPSLIMLVTFVLGWAISTTERFPISVFAECSQTFFRAQAFICRDAAWTARIPSCLSPLAGAMERELLLRKRDREAAQRYERWRQDRAAQAGAVQAGAGSDRQRQLQEDLLQPQGEQPEEQELEEALWIHQGQHKQHEQQHAEAGRQELERAEEEEEQEQEWLLQQLLQLRHLLEQQQQPVQEGGGDGSGLKKRGGRDAWRRTWGMLRHRGEANVNRSPGEQAGREVVMALLAASKRPQVGEALQQCRWQEMVAHLFGPTIMNIFNQMLGPSALLTFDEWVLMTSTINATLAASGRRSALEATLQYLLTVMPMSGVQPGWVALVPDTPQVRAFAAHMSATSTYFDDLFLGVFESVTAAMDAAEVVREPAPRAAAASGAGDSGAGADSAPGGGPGGGVNTSVRGQHRPPLLPPSRLWAVLEFKSGPERGVGADYSIRMKAMHVPSTFSKLSPPECKTCSADFIPYVGSGFLSLQAAVAGYVVGLEGSAADGAPGTSLSEATAWLPPPAPTSTAGATEGQSVDKYGVWFTPLPNMGQEVNAFYEYGAPLLGLIATCSFALPLSLLVRSMTSQRQSGLQHLLEVLGLTRQRWLLAWMAAGLPVLGAAFATEGLLSWLTYLRLVQPGLLAAVMGAAALAATAWGVLLGGCFRDAKVAAAGSFVVTLMVGLPHLALYSAAPSQLVAVRRACCLMWPFAMSLLLQRMAAGHQLRRFGADRHVSTVPGLDWSSATHGPLSTAELVGFLVLDAGLYLAAAAALAVWRGLRGPHRRQGGSRGRGGGGRGGDGGGGKEEEVVLELREVTHRYPGSNGLTLDGVSLSVAAGEAVALLGRNAAGKSTLVAVASGRLEPAGGGGAGGWGGRTGGGAVRVGSCDMYGDLGASGRAGLLEGSGGGSASASLSDAYRQLGYCPQGDVQLPDLTASEHLQLALVLRGSGQEGRGRGTRGGSWGGPSGSRRQLAQAAERLAERVSLPADMMQVLSGQLSGGSRRKLQLALALAGEPRVLLLDEVSAGVDVESQQAIWRALRQAKLGPWGGQGAGEDGALLPGGLDRPAGHGAALLFTSHHLDEVAELADRVAVLEGGRLESLLPAAALLAPLRGGSPRVLRVTTRPAPLPGPEEQGQGEGQGEGKAANRGGAPRPRSPVPSLTKYQLLDLITRQLGPGTARVLYNTWTSTAVYIGEGVQIPAALMAGVGGSCVGDTDGDGDDGNTQALYGSRLAALVSLLEQIRPHKLHKGEGDGAAGGGPSSRAVQAATAQQAATGTSLAPPKVYDTSGDLHDSIRCWDAQPLVVVRFGLCAPSLENVLQLISQRLHEGPGGAAAPGATEKQGLPAGTSWGSGVGAAAVAPTAIRITTTTIPPTTTSKRVEGDLRSGAPPPDTDEQKSPKTQPPPAAARSSSAGDSSPRSGGGAGCFRGIRDLFATLPPLLTKHLTVWLRDGPSTARLLLLPVLVVGLALLALSIRPPTSGPPAPLNLDWLGQDQPTPAAGLPASWQQAATAAAATAAATGGAGGGGEAGVGGGAAAGPAAALAAAGLVALRPEWVAAAQPEGSQRDSGPSSVALSQWFVSKSKTSSSSSSREGAGVAGDVAAALPGAEPSAPLQAALVFGDVDGSQLSRRMWYELGWLMEALVAPSEWKEMGLSNPQQLRNDLRAIIAEDGSLIKMLDFLYDRMLLHELISLVRYVMGVTEDWDIMSGAIGSNSSSVSGLGFTGRRRGRQLAAAAAGRGGGGGLFSFFRLGHMLDLCDLEVPGLEEKEEREEARARRRERGRGREGERVQRLPEQEAAELHREGGRALLMSYRPPLNVSLYLMAGLLPLEHRFCPLARLLVEQSNSSAQVLRSHMARRQLPALNLMWNITSPHGLPATLNHLHNVMLQLRQGHPEQGLTTHGTAAADGQQGHDGKDGDGGGARQLRGVGDVTDQQAYGRRMYGKAAIRVRNHPLPPRGGTSSVAGLMDHLLLALMLALPLSYTTGSFVVRAASEAASGAKQQQLAAGRASPLSYWLSFWLVDLGLHSVIAGGVVAVMAVGQADAFAGSLERCGGLAALLLAGAAASLPWGYCIGLRCTTPASAQGLVSTAGLLAGVGLAVARQVLAHVERWSWLAARALPVMRLMPPFCLVDGLIQMALLDVILALTELLGMSVSNQGFVRSILQGHLVGIDPTNSSPFQRNVLGDNLIYLAFDTLLYGTVLLALEWCAARGSLFPPALGGVQGPGRGFMRSARPLGRVGAALRGAGAAAMAAATALRAVLYGRRIGTGSGLLESGDGSSGQYGPEYGAGGYAALGAPHRRGGRRVPPRLLKAAQGRKGPEGADTGGDEGGGAGGMTTGIAGEESVEEVPEPAPDCLVRVYDLRKVYSNGRVALRGLSFGLRHGECLALIGRNGAGKSTALAVLSGRLPPSDGRVVVGGVDVAGRPEAARSRVAMCPQMNPLLPLLSPAEHLVLYSALYGAITTTGRTCAATFQPASAVLPADAASVARRCGLSAELMDRPAGQLSGGSQRKLSLAIALLGRPQLLLLDEPSAGLDPAARRTMCDTVNMAVRGWEGGGPTRAPAVVLTTHHGEEAVALCDVVGVLEGGRLVAYGRPEAALVALRRGRPEHYLADPAEWGELLAPLPLGE